MSAASLIIASKEPYFSVEFDVDVEGASVSGCVKSKAARILPSTPVSCIRSRIDGRNGTSNDQSNESEYSQWECVLVSPEFIHYILERLESVPRRSRMRFGLLYSVRPSQPLASVGVLYHRPKRAPRKRRRYLRW